MADDIEIIIRALDEASEIFKTISDTVADMSNDVTDSVDSTNSSFNELSDAADTVESDFEEISDSADNVNDSLNEINPDSLDDVESSSVNLSDELLVTLSNVNDVCDALLNVDGSGFDGLSDSVRGANDELTQTASNIDDIMTVGFQQEVFTGLSGGLMDCVNSAGNFEDSMTRATLAMEGAGISSDAFKSAVNSLSEDTGRAGGIIREAFISMTSAGITNVDSMKQMFEGASAQAFVLGVDVQSLADKYSGLSMKSSVAERTLKGTGITVQELGEVLGIQGATIDDINAKWETMDTNSRAAALGQAAAMNEGKNANDEYKDSWQGLHDQVDIASGRIMRLAGSVILPTLIPALEFASDILQGVGDVVSWLMDSPLGGLISILGTVAGLFIIAMTGASLLSTVMGALGVEATLTAIAESATALAMGEQSLAAYASFAANIIGATGFGALASAAWSAALAIAAAMLPLLPWIALAAAVAVAIYELGEAFGWWTDVSSMLDAIWSGVQRLWDAFINHPDVQAVIQTLTDVWNILSSAVGEAWDAVSEFLNLSTGGDFDIVHAIIEAIGFAWQMITTPIRTVIFIIQQLIGFFEYLGSGQNELVNTVVTGWSLIYSTIMGVVQPILEMISGLVTIFIELMTGQISLQEAITEAWDLISTTLTEVLNVIIENILSFALNIGIYALTAGLNFFYGLWNYISQIPQMIWDFLSNAGSYIVSTMSNWVSTAQSKALELILSVFAYFAQIPVRVYAYMVNTASRIISGAVQWVSNARSKAVETVNAVVNQVSQLPGKVYDEFIKIAQRIRDSISEAVNAATSFGSDVVNAVLGALGIASPGTIQRKTIKEFMDTIDRIMYTRSSAYHAGKKFAESIVTGFGDVELSLDELLTDNTIFDGNGETSIDLSTGKVFDITTGEYYEVDNISYIDGNIIITHDLENVPEGVDEATLAEMINDSADDENFVKRIAQNINFQKYDLREKDKIDKKNNRDKGVNHV